MLKNNLQNQRVTLAITGASGVVYALRLLECLVAENWQISLIISNAAQIVLAEELEIKLPQEPDLIADFFRERFNAKPQQIQFFAQQNWYSAAASGSNAPQKMVVIPCSMGTLAAIAHGMSDNLLERAADVAIKENNQLILVPREAPFSAIHLENMLKLANAGVTILPAAPAFYGKPNSIADLVNSVVGRVLQQLGIAHQLGCKWGAN